MKNLKFYIYIILTALSVQAMSQNTSAVSQKGKFKLSFQYGRSNASDKFKQAQPGHSFEGDASYFFTERFFVTAHFNTGRNSYYEDYSGTTPECIPNPNPEKDDVNARLYMNNVGLLAGYQLPVTRWMNLSAQLGVAQHIAIRVFPIMPPKDEIIYNLGALSQTLYSISFPVKFSVGFRVLEFLELGLSYGFYIEPDYNPPSAIVGMYFGPHLSFVF